MLPKFIHLLARNKIILILLCAAYFLFVNKSFYDLNPKTNYSIVKNLAAKPAGKILLAPTKCEKWIVITTISWPTNHVKYIRDSSMGWCVVVVADKKTPDDWNYRDVHFLSISKQMDLMQTYKIIGSISYNSYLRKMIGYLYAMSQNATIIYETDDDNAPTDGLYGFRYKQLNGLESNCNETFINPYSYFGQPSVWPRGYPLEKISESTKCKSFSLHSATKVFIFPLLLKNLCFILN